MGTSKVIHDMKLGRFYFGAEEADGLWSKDAGMITADVVNMGSEDKTMIGFPLLKIDQVHSGSKTF